MIRWKTWLMDGYLIIDFSCVEVEVEDLKLTTNLEERKRKMSSSDFVFALKGILVLMGYEDGEGDDGDNGDDGDDVIEMFIIIFFGNTLMRS